MVRHKLFKSDDPTEVDEAVTAWFTEMKLGKTQLLSTSVNQTEVSLIVLIVYDDGQPS